MPMPGLSLVGFMEWPQAAQHLRAVCMPADPSDAAISAIWQNAQATLGPPIAKAGAPDILPWPHAAHSGAILNGADTGIDFLPIPGFNNLFGSTFHIVEIDPLLAFQHTVVSEVIDRRKQTLSSPPTDDQLLNMCLPLIRPQEPIDDRVVTPQYATIRSESLNLRIMGPIKVPTTMQGQVPGSGTTFVRSLPAFGIALDHGSPFVHVVRVQGRCILHNGYHRACAARAAGATHVPCIIQDVPNYAAAGVREDGATFNSALLGSANPPTVGHFTQGRALDVQIRRQSRLITLNWTQQELIEP